MMGPVGGLAGAMSNTENVDDMGGSDIGAAESVSGCDQQSRGAPLAWLLILAIAGWTRARARRLA